MVAKRPHLDLPWHDASDQPRRISDPALKRRLRVVAMQEYLRSVPALVGLTPLIAWRFLEMQPPVRKPIAAQDFIGLGVTPDAANAAAIRDLVAELGVRRLLLRVPVWHRDRIDEYAGFIRSFPDCQFLVVVVQDRGSVCDLERWERDLRSIFAGLPGVEEFQIGQAPNRTKWGILHHGEYFDLLERAQRLRREFPKVKLGGPSLIDFEPLAMVRTLINCRRFTLDAVCAGMYVDRRGAPASRQYGVFDLERKIRLQATIASLSPRCTAEAKGRLWITETNWPLADTGEHCPTGRDLAVTEDVYADYLRGYYQQAYATGLVERCYWWQLIAAGYGLIDPRGGVLRKRPGFQVFKRLLSGEIELKLGQSYRVGMTIFS